MKTVKILAQIVFCLALSINLPAQVTQQWVQRYNGPLNSGIQVAQAIATDNSGNIYVTGYTYDSLTNYATVKYNSNGVIQWASVYNGTGHTPNLAYAVAVDNSGNVYVTGESRASSGNYNDYATVKYNSSGTQVWEARYNGPGLGLDAAKCIKVDNSGNVYVTGFSSGGTSTNFDYATIKYNSSGIQQWIARYNGTGSGDDEASSIAVDIFGNVYVTGKSTGTTSNYDYATIKYNSSGIQQWSMRYNGPGNSFDIATSLTVDDSGNSFVTGSSVGSGTGDDYATIKYNSAGVEQWAARFNGQTVFQDEANAIVIDNSGNVYVTGRSSHSGSDYDFATVKYNTSGVQMWASVYNGAGSSHEDEAKAIALDALGNVYVTGYLEATSANWDYATIKYNSSGAQQWIQTYNGPGNGHDQSYSLVLDPSGNVYITGESLGGGTGYDYATIKYSQSVGINNISSDIPKSFSLLQNYPNPFNPATNINFSIPKAGSVKLTVYNMLGKELETLVNENLTAGSYIFNFNGNNLTSGVYFYKIESQEFIDIKKMTLIK